MSVKQKVVIKVSMNGHKDRSKALKIAVGMSGVESAAVAGQDKNQLEVIGVGVDAVELATILRKKMCNADLVSVGAVPDKKKEEEEKKKKEEEEKKKKAEAAAKAMAAQHQMVWPQYAVPNYPYYAAVPVSNHYSDPSCSIM